MGSIFDDNEVMLFGNFCNCVHLTRSTVEMNGNDCSCLRSDGFFNPLCIDELGITLYVYQHWFSSCMDDGIHSCAEGHRGSNDFISLSYTSS